MRRAGGSASPHIGLCVAAALAGCALISAELASAKFQAGIDGTSQYTSDDRDFWLDQTVELNAETVRINVGWDGIASARPSSPADPSDPAYDFSSLDASVAGAADRGLRIVLTFVDAPDYAQAGPDPRGLAGAWRPKPAALGAFARAVAARYRAVRDYEVWNEPNLEVFLAPQWTEGRAVAVKRYREMVNAVARAVHVVDSRNRVVVGSLAPYGDPPGGSRTRPVTFLRKLFCLTGRLERRSCPTKTRLDVLAHHPINQSGPPRQSAISPNDASSPDLPRVVRVLRAAERERTITGGRKRHPLWVTEFWWTNSATSPTDFSPKPRRQARYIQESMFLFWEAGTKVAIYFPLVDSFGFFAGLFEEDGSPRPAAQAFAFPFVAEKTREDDLRAWGKSPLTGRLQIERRRAGAWHKVKGLDVKAGQVFVTKLPLSAPVRLRATVGDEHSLRWNQR